MSNRGQDFPALECMIFPHCGLPVPAPTVSATWTWEIGLWMAVGTQRCIPPQFLAEAITPSRDRAAWRTLIALESVGLTLGCPPGPLSSQDSLRHEQWCNADPIDALGSE